MFRIFSYIFELLKKIYSIYNNQAREFIIFFAIIFGIFFGNVIYPKIELEYQKKEVLKNFNKYHLFVKEASKEKQAINYVKSFPLYSAVLEKYKEEFILNKKELQQDINKLKKLENINPNIPLKIKDLKKELSKIDNKIQNIKKYKNEINKSHQVYHVLLKNNIPLTNNDIDTIFKLHNQIKNYILNKLITSQENLSKNEILQNQFLYVIWKKENINNNNPEELLQYPLKINTSKMILIRFVVFISGMFLFIVGVLLLYIIIGILYITIIDLIVPTYKHTHPKKTKIKYSIK